MTTVSRNEFARELSRNDGALNINDLSKETAALFKQYGITEADLKKAAGKDGQIKGSREFKKLFGKVDKVDNDGSARSMRTRDDLVDGSSVATKAGELYDALKKDVESYRQMAHNRGVIHLGMRKASTSEADALGKAAKNQGGVHSIKGWDSNGKVTVDGKSYDLTDKKGLDAFCQKCVANGMPKKQAHEFRKFIEGQDKNVRDDFAQLGLALFNAGEGKLAVNRLVLSGHSSGDGVESDGMEEVSFENVAKLAKMFPKGAGKIEHIAVSACNCGYVEQIDTFKRAFPNMKSYLGYSGFSPKAETNAPKHLKTWEGMTDGDDPSQVDKFGSDTATWNVKDGYRGHIQTVASLETDAKNQRSAYEKYANGSKTAKPGTHDADLDEYYITLTRLEHHPSLSSARKAEVTKERAKVFLLRMTNHE